MYPLFYTHGKITNELQKYKYVPSVFEKGMVMNS